MYERPWAMIYLHIGTHKTGSKSLQRFLCDHRDHLRSTGYAFYRGFERNMNNHVELHLACLRETRDSFARLRWPHLGGTAYRAKTAAAVRRFLEERETAHAVFSNEDLCLLRFEDELADLHEMLSVTSEEIRVVLYLRKKADFLRSYNWQLQCNPERQPSDDPRSALYVEEDSWLADYDALVAGFARAFGPASMQIIDYDAARNRTDGIIGAFQEALLLPPDARRSGAGYLLNASTTHHPGQPKN
jgi:hypothetical protein